MFAFDFEVFYMLYHGKIHFKNKYCCICIEKYKRGMLRGILSIRIFC